MLSTLDWITIALYFAGVWWIAWWAYRKRKDTTADYFLAGRDVGWFVVGASLFVSNIGSEHLVGLAGTGANSGVAVGQFEILASLVLLLLGWVFVPFYIRSGVFTMPEFLERRYSSSARWYLTVISIISYVLTKISVTIYAGGVVFSALTGRSFWLGAVLIVLFTGAYTIMGGLRAVVYTDLMQMFVLLGASAAVLVLGVMEVGGWGELRATAGSSFFNMWQPVTDPSFPWTGIIFGAPILGIWYWCTDQTIVQRTLGARDQGHARRGSIFAGYLKVLPVFLFVIPGIIAYVLVQQGKLHLDRSDQALPALVGYLLPAGARGIVVAGMFAALMSSLSAVFNSSSTLITNDIYKPLHPQASERQLTWVGRVSTTVIVLLGLAWIPFMGNISQRLYEYLQSVQAYISPPIAAVFIFGIAWKRINATGAMSSLISGFGLGALRLVLELANGVERTGLPAGSIWETIAEFNFLHFAAVLFVICSAVLIFVSLATAEPPREKVAGLTYATADERPPFHEMEIAAEENPHWRRTDWLLTLGILVLVGAVWVYFSG